VTWNEVRRSFSLPLSLLIGLRKIAERLATRYQVTLTHVERKKSPGHSVTPEAITLFHKQADFVLAGIGD